MNKEIAAVEDLNENYQIGTSYFLKLKTLSCELYDAGRSTDCIRQKHQYDWKCIAFVRTMTYTVVKISERS